MDWHSVARVGLGRVRDDVWLNWLGGPLSAPRLLRGFRSCRVCLAVSLIRPGKPPETSQTSRNNLTKNDVQGNPTRRSPKAGIPPQFSQTTLLKPAKQLSQPKICRAPLPQTTNKQEALDICRIFGSRDAGYRHRVLAAHLQGVPLAHRPVRQLNVWPEALHEVWVVADLRLWLLCGA